MVFHRLHVVQGQQPKGEKKAATPFKFFCIFFFFFYIFLPRYHCDSKKEKPYSQRVVMIKYASYVHTYKLPSVNVCSMLPCGLVNTMTCPKYCKRCLSFFVCFIVLVGTARKSEI